MLAASIPYKFQYTWGQNAGSGYIRPIPATSSDQNTASQSLGFPPNTFKNTSAGGKPPDGRDENGGLGYCTAWAQWFQAGMIINPWDSTFSTWNGGYPEGAIVQTALDGSLWLSLSDNNTDDPLSYATNQGANWISSTLALLYGTDTGTANALILNLPYTRDALIYFDGYHFKIKKGASPNTAGVTLNLNSFGAKPVVHSDGAAIAPDELPANGYFICVYDNASGTFQLMGNAAPTRTPWAIKAWAIYDAVTQTLVAAYNISNVTYNGVGEYTFNLDASPPLVFTAGGVSVTANSNSQGTLVGAAQSNVIGSNPAVEVFLEKPATGARTDADLCFVQIVGQTSS
jgi:hypothetical protein